MKKLNFKKFFLSLLLILFAITIVGCKDPNNNNGDDKQYTVEDLKTEYTNKLKLETSFENKKFLLEGIEKVTLLRVIDGDTAHFVDGARNTLKIRFLGINTPESTIRIAPWGKQASVYVKNILENAYEIVIEANEIGVAPEVDTTGERYLGYVWYRKTATEDLRLLNLEIIEQCFSYFTGETSSLKYGQTMMDAYVAVKKTKLRVFGEKDPHYDYDMTLNEITIAELRNDFASFSAGSRLKLEVRVVRLVGNSLFVEDINETINPDTQTSSRAGIFLFHSFVNGLGKYKPGQIISFEAQATMSDDYGMQLVNASNLRSVQQTSEYTIREVGNSVTNLSEYEGFVVKVKGVKIERVSKEAASGAYTIYGTMVNGAELMIRVDADASPKLDPDSIQVGSKYDVIGGVSRYNNPYENKTVFQIKLGNLNPETSKDFVLSQ